VTSKNGFSIFMDKMFYEHMCFGSEYSLIMNEYIKISEKKKRLRFGLTSVRGIHIEEFSNFIFMKKKLCGKRAPLVTTKKFSVNPVTP